MYGHHFQQIESQSGMVANLGHSLASKENGPRSPFPRIKQCVCVSKNKHYSYFLFILTISQSIPLASSPI